ncbi:hypothetical protein HK405_010710 [Cladochytrium tenue]|nr:hypothetical protein HK405_010710 [Cladochytrium tenue]
MASTLFLAGAHVLITGASGGVGLETARVLLDAGASVSLHYATKREPLEQILAEYPGRTVAVGASATSESDVAACVRSAVEALGPITTLVVSHAVFPEQDVAVKDMALAQWRNTIAVNLDGTFLFCRHVVLAKLTPTRGEYLRQLEAAVKQKRPLKHVGIVMIGSTAGKFGEAMHADYSATKSAMMYGLTLSLKNEIVKIHPRGRVNTVSPGKIPSVYPPAPVLFHSPLKKISEPRDVANAILFLSSEDLSGNITGISLDVNAGMEGRLLNKPEDV